MKITKKHFNLFKREFIKWQKIFNLELDYAVRFHFGLKDNKFKNAYIHKDFDNGLADVYFDKYYDIALDNLSLSESIKKSARHEAIHLLLCPLETYGKWRWTTEEQFTEALEQTTRKLEQLIQ